jgi:hypothetical protein
MNVVLHQNKVRTSIFIQWHRASLHGMIYSQSITNNHHQLGAITYYKHTTEYLFLSRDHPALSPSIYDI